MFLPRDSFEAVGVLPFLRSRYVVSDAFLEEGWLLAILHCPVVPLFVQLVQVDEACFTESDAANLALRGSGPRMIPWPDDQVVVFFSPGRTVAHVSIVMFQGSLLVAIVIACYS